MEPILSYLSASSEDDIKNKLIALLKNLAIYKTMLKSPPKYTKPFSSSNISNIHRIRRNSGNGSTTKRRLTGEYYPTRGGINTTPQNKSNPYEIEASLIINNSFTKLIERHSNTHWVQLKDERLCNICIVKQFWLDCFVADQEFLNLLMNPLIGKQWINADLFHKSFEALHYEGLKNKFTFKKSGKSSRSLKIQKNIFFFNVVRFIDDQDLNKEELAKALSMAEKRPKLSLEGYIERIMSKASEIHQNHCHRISSNDFFNIITSIDL